MLLDEARWFRRQLATFPSERLSPMLNVGSQTWHFRRFVQPWIELQVFEPLHHRGVTVVHTDIRSGIGVDIAGDLTDEQFLKKLQSYRFRSVFCSNLLEHVSQPETMASRLVQLVEHGGLLFVSCPRVFPFHPDPIDTLFRPNVAQLASLFPQTRLVAGEIVDCGPLWHYILARLRAWYQEHFLPAAKLNKSHEQISILPGSQDGGRLVSEQLGQTSQRARESTRQAEQTHSQPNWRQALRLATWLCRPVSATCVVLEVASV